MSSGADRKGLENMEHLKFIRNAEGKITRRIITDRAYIENKTLYVDGKPWAMIGGTFDMKEAIRTGKLFQ